MRETCRENKDMVCGGRAKKPARAQREDYAEQRELKSSNRKKNIPLNTYVSIYSPVYSEQGEETEGSFMVDHSLEAAELSPEEILIDRENVHSLRFKRNV